MSQPLYFLPGIDRQTFAPGDRPQATVLRERGLEAAFGDVRHLPSECFSAEIARSGLAGAASGLLLTYQLANGALPLVTAINTQTHTWREVIAGKLWIGFDPASPPTSKELARRRQCQGYNIDFANHEWQIPIVRRHAGGSRLPTEIYFDAAGNLQQPIQPAYQQHWDATAEVADWFYGGGWNDSLLPRGIRIAVDLLGINYRYGLAEHNALRYIDTAAMMLVLGLAVDTPMASLLEEQQKKTPSSPGTVSGVPIISPTIAPTSDGLPNTTPGPTGD